MGRPCDGLRYPRYFSTTSAGRTCASSGFRPNSRKARLWRSKSHAWSSAMPRSLSRSLIGSRLRALAKDPLLLRHETLDVIEHSPIGGFVAHGCQSSDVPTLADPVAHVQRSGSLRRGQAMRLVVGPPGIKHDRPPVPTPNPASMPATRLVVSGPSMFARQRRSRRKRRSLASSGSSVPSRGRSSRTDCALRPPTWLVRASTSPAEQERYMARLYAAAIRGTPARYGFYTRRCPISRRSFCAVWSAT